MIESVLVDQAGHALRDVKSIVTRTDEGDTASDCGFQEGHHQKRCGAPIMGTLLARRS